MLNPFLYQSITHKQNLKQLKIMETTTAQKNTVKTTKAKFLKCKLFKVNGKRLRLCKHDDSTNEPYSVADYCHWHYANIEKVTESGIYVYYMFFDKVVKHFLPYYKITILE